MPATVVFDTPRSRGEFYNLVEKTRRGTINLGVYVTGGVPVTPGLFHLKTIDRLEINPSYVNGQLYSYDRANAKVKAFSAVGTEQAQTDISANLARFEASGK